MPRRRLYPSNAERQAAYRARLAVRQARVSHVPQTVSGEQLEAALVAMTSRAEKADRRAVEAERRAEAAVRQARALKLSLAALQLQMEATAASNPSRNRRPRRHE